MALPLLLGLAGSGLAGAGMLGGMGALTAGAIGSGLGSYAYYSRRYGLDDIKTFF